MSQIKTFTMSKKAIAESLLHGSAIHARNSCDISTGEVVRFTTITIYENGVKVSTVKVSRVK